MAKSQSIPKLEELRSRLEEAEETIEAIRSGKIDALVGQSGGKKRNRPRIAFHGSRIYLLWAHFSSRNRYWP